MKRVYLLLTLALLLCGSVTTASFAQAQTGAKDDLKNAGHSAKDTAKSTGKAVKKGTKKAVHAGAKQTRKGANKVESKTKE